MDNHNVHKHLILLKYFYHTLDMELLVDYIVASLYLFLIF